MKYVINRADRAPAYLQLYRQLRSDIAHEVYPAGSRLPSKRLLSEELGLSLVTVEHAYALLVDEGYAEARQRSGVYAAFGGASAPPPAPLEAMRVSGGVPDSTRVQKLRSAAARAAISLSLRSITKRNSP